MLKRLFSLTSPSYEVALTGLLLGVVGEEIVAQRPASCGINHVSNANYGRKCGDTESIGGDGGARRKIRCAALEEHHLPFLLQSRSPHKAALYVSFCLADLSIISDWIGTTALG